MILVGNQRGGAKDLALHLLKEENEHVEIHELRSFASDDLVSALRESYAISRGTRCKKHLYSLSLNPPKDETVCDESFIAAIYKAESALGLSGQPRAVVFHTKPGLDGALRRHAHAVWCRIDTECMKAIHISHDHRKLAHLSRALYLEHNWKLPRGHVNPLERDPRNFSLAQWQQAKRAKKDPKALKAVFQDCWAQSDSRYAFAHAIKERGYVLAKGDRRGFVAVDYKGEVYPVSRWVGIKAKDVAARLGDLSSLPSVGQAQAQASRTVSDRLKELREEENREAQNKLRQLEEKRKQAAQNQREARRTLVRQQAQRKTKEEAARLAKLRKGLPGMLDRITGKRKRTVDENKIETAKAEQRDRQEKHNLSQEQRSQQQALKAGAENLRTTHKALEQELSTDIKNLDAAQLDDKAARKEAFKAKRKAGTKQRQHRHPRDGPDYER